MIKTIIYPLILAIMLCPALLVSGQVRSAKRVKKSYTCAAGLTSFPCPKKYKVLLNGSKTENSFLAKNTEYSYSVFVISSEANFDSDDVLFETEKGFLKTLYPKFSQEFQWKTVEFQNKQATSKYETGKKLIIGFNGKEMVTLDHRKILFKGNKLIVGTIVDSSDADFPGMDGLTGRHFNEGLYTASGACFDALGIINSFTGEKESQDMNPCIYTISIGG